MGTIKLPQGEEKTRQVRAMFDAIAPRYELVNKLMTFGLDARWRRRAVGDLRLAPNSLVLDIAAGTGDFTRELIRQGHRAVATDISFGMLEAGRDVPERVQADASALPFCTASFDGITCGYALRNFTDLAATFDEMARVTRPGGRISLLEVAEPAGGLLRAGFRLWFRRIVPFIGSLVSDRAAYHYLPQSTAYLPEAEEIVRMLNRAGFSAVNHRRVMGGLSQQFLGTRSQ
ncbi:MAG TPA: ubiquinone/menaquinone biosynthesis methyltransferase [Acidimicrobiales bacterium]|nr:ubiquinone/menaquinone biosynthesis methyltransferase [Acidimicrobiales bacterium]